MIRINRETDYGIGILSLMAREAERRFTTSLIAEWRRLPQPMVSKILKHLARHGILISYRGVKGGYGLARAPENISLAQIIAALEGPIALTECVEEGRDACQYGSHCTVSENWNRINRMVEKALADITLAEMSTPEPTGEQATTAHPLEFTGVRHVRDH